MGCEVCSTPSFRCSFCEAGSAHPEEGINGLCGDAGKGCWEPWRRWGSFWFLCYWQRHSELNFVSVDCEVPLKLQEEK